MISKVTGLTEAEIEMILKNSPACRSVRPRRD